MQARKLFAELVTGSHLYGTTRVGSDLDLFRIVYPTRQEAVANRSVTIPQSFDDGSDVRTVLLGDFVMSLGTDIDRTLTALHHPELFGEITNAFLCEAFLDRVITVARRINDNASSDKMRAHAYRYWQAYVNLHNQADRPLYPMSARERSMYLAIRDGAPVRVDWTPTINLRAARIGSVSEERLADWVWAKYQEAL